MSKAKRRARALATPLELARMETRRTLPRGSKRLAPEALSVTDKRLKAESQHGANVPERVVERMDGVGTTGARITDGDGVARLRPKRKARSLGGEAAAAGLVGRGFASKSDGIKRLSDEKIRDNRAEYFASTAANRKAQKSTQLASVHSDSCRVAAARADYQRAIGESRARTAIGDDSGAEAWMTKAREYRRIFRNL
ncbi:hypothetical protein ACFQ61_08140 [Streptomyces sp. NPDC056500]|uniref:hypothetical protein n=1 Tax=Streptomyces sp. NPDC056500 TaxID=3345840 RepID=UPI0036B92B09